MTRAERRRGWVFFALYLLVLPHLNAWAQRLLAGDAEVPVAEANQVYYALLFAGALLLFWSFLREDLHGLIEALPENLFSLVAGFVGAEMLSLLLIWLPLPVGDPIPGQYAAQYQLSPAATLMLLLVLIPVVEEVLFRGLLFGGLRQYSVPLAYAVTVAGYALAVVWRYALERGDARYLLLAAAYLPVSLALTWCYDNGGSVWSCAALHSLLNGAALAAAL